MRRLRTSIALFVFFAIYLVSALAQPVKFNMREGVTPISHHLYDLHMAIFGICVIIGIIVFSLLIYAIIKHRKSKGHKAATFTHKLSVEIVWIVIPTLILIGMAVPATFVLMRMHDDAKADLTIKITGFQWKWKYDYLDQGISFFSMLSTPLSQIEGKEKKNKWYLLQVDKPLVVPIHTKIRFLVTSNDVIHSWWVPDLGIKRDAVPGFVYEAWARIDKPGTYRGQCAELCGVNHAFMPIVVIAKTRADFEKWVAIQTGKIPPETPATPEGVTPQAKPAAPKEWTLETLMKQGKEVYTKICAVCHKPNGEGMPPAFPAMKGSKIATGPANAHIDIVLNGKKGTAMQAFKEQLNAEELASVITYERNSFGNDDKQKFGPTAGGIVKPEEITKILKK